MGSEERVMTLMWGEALTRGGPGGGRGGTKWVQHARPVPRGAQDGPRDVQDGQETSKTAQERSNGAPRRPKSDPREPKTAQDGLKTVQEGSKTAQEALQGTPKRAREAKIIEKHMFFCMIFYDTAHTAQKAPKRAPIRPKRAPRRPKKDP